MEYASQFLSHRNRTSKEISQKLKNKGFSPGVLESVIEYFKNNNLINDLDFAKTFAESRLKKQNLGKSRIQQDLIRYGIDRSVAENAIIKASALLPEEFSDDNERAYHSLIKRVKQVHIKDFQKLRYFSQPDRKFI